MGGPKEFHNGFETLTKNPPICHNQSGSGFKKTLEATSPRYPHRW